MTSSPIVPFSEPPWLQGLPSPYYNDSHRAFQKYCREFITKNLTDYAFDWEREGTVPEHVYAKFTEKSGYLDTVEHNAISKLSESENELT